MVHCGFLGKAREKQPIILFIDALDQLPDSPSINWLPKKLPKHVHLLVSTQPGKSQQSISTRISPGKQIELQHLSVDQGEHILSNWLNEWHRTLQPVQKQKILEAFEKNGLPLYLRLLVDAMPALEIRQRGKYAFH